MRLSLLILISFLKLSGSPNSGFESMVRSFQSPVPENSLWCYWYWINDDISKQGITRDLKAMKQAGISTALIGNINRSEKDGKVLLLSDDWWNHMVHAVIEGKRIGVDIGVFNCPGWSQSGGPWVTYDKAMRYLTYSQLEVQGGEKLQIQLKKPNAEFQDVKVIAYPFKEKEFKKLNLGNTKVLLNGNDAEFLLDNNKILSKKVSNKKYTIELISDQSIAAQSIQLFPSKKRLKANIVVEAMVNGAYKKVRSFQYERTRFSANVGPEIYAPVTMSFTKTKASHFKITVTKIGSYDSETFSEIIITEEPILESFVEKKLGKMHQTPYPSFNSYRWNAQQEPSNGILQSSEVLDISSKMNSNGLLTWEVPAGIWIVQRYGMTPTGTKNAPAAPRGTGYEIDKASEPLARFHFEQFIGKLLEKIPEKAKSAFKYVVADSYEVGSQNWSDQFEQRFQESYGYDPIPFLPVFSGKIVENVQKTERFLWDLRRLIADQVAYQYCGGLRKICNQNGLKLWLENYGHFGFPSEFMIYGGQSDLVSGEYWNEGILGNIECKAASSTAHAYGKKRVFAECFTAGGRCYVRHPAILKKRGDWSLTEGINHHVLHLYIHQPDDSRVPGINAAFSTEFNRHNTWFRQGKTYFNYLRRAQHLLQQGNYVADVCYFIGEDTPLMTGPRVTDLPHGYSYDYINAEVILKRLTVKDGRLTLPDGMSYRMMVLPPIKTMRPKLLQKIEQLVKGGAIILGDPPISSPSLQNYPDCDDQIQKISKKMWSNQQSYQSYGKGTIFRGLNTREVLKQLGIEKDVELPHSVLFTHRKTKDTDIYFLTNQSSKTIHISPTFRMTKKNVQLWDAVTGKIRVLPERFEKQGRITVPIKMEANRSWFVIFTNNSSAKIQTIGKKNFPPKHPVYEIKGTWKLDFLEKKYGPAKTVVTDNLFDWSDSKNEKIKYYSGEATYTIEFNYPTAPTKRLYIEFEKVGVIGTVLLNGEKVGTTWIEPHQLEISELIKKGTNKLTVRVVNVWRNRLTGDRALPKKAKHTFTIHDNFRKKESLIPSGLIGKVKILESS